MGETRKETVFEVEYVIEESEESFNEDCDNEIQSKSNNFLEQADNDLFLYQL